MNWYNDLSYDEKRELAYDLAFSRESHAKILKEFGEIIIDDNNLVNLYTPAKRLYVIGPGPTFQDTISRKRSELSRLICILAGKNEEEALDFILSHFPKPKPKKIIIKEHTKKKPFQLWSAETLLQTSFPEQNWIINKILPQGSTTLLSGASKVGKSWLALDIAATASTGGSILGNLIIEPCNSLYIALEDTPRRLQNRMRKQASNPSDNFIITTEWPRGSEAIFSLYDIIAQYPDLKLIIIDTLGRFASFKDGNDYAEMTGVLASIKAVADEFNIAIIIIHHTRKNDSSDDFVNSSLGSVGIAGAVDSIMILTRKRGTHDGKLSITGRDIEEKEFAVKFNTDCCRWDIIGDAQDVANTNAQQEILDIIRESDKPLLPNQIASLIGKNRSTVRSLLKKLNNSGHVYRYMNGLYSLSNQLQGTDGKLKSVDTINNINSVDSVDTVDST